MCLAEVLLLPSICILGFTILALRLWPNCGDCLPFSHGLFTTAFFLTSVCARHWSITFFLHLSTSLISRQISWPLINFLIRCWELIFSFMSLFIANTWPLCWKEVCLPILWEILFGDIGSDIVGVGFPAPFEKYGFCVFQFRVFKPFCWIGLIYKTVLSDGDHCVLVVFDVSALRMVILGQLLMVESLLVIRTFHHFVG